MKKLTLLEAQTMPCLLFKIKAKGRKRIELMMANAGNTQMQVNCMDSVVWPAVAEKRSEFQRLLVLGSEEGQDTVTLPPGQRRVWILQTVCMDESKKIPDGKIEYSVSKETPTPRLKKAVAEWRSQRNENLSQDRLPSSDETKDQEWVQQVAWGHITSKE